MKITKLKVGLTLPGIAETGNARMEIEIDVEDRKDITEVVKEAKLMLAEQISGGDPKQYQRAIKYLNPTGLESELEAKLAQMEIVEQELERTNKALKEARAEAKALLWSLEELKVLDRIRDAYNPAGSFWHGFAAVIKQVFPEKYNTDKIASDSTDNKTEQTTTDSSKGLPF